jgi:LPXTG-site transpeptidase (sortase) family protein
MNKKIFVILLVSLLLVNGLLLTQGTTVASSRPLMGFTVTPEQPTIAAPSPVPTAIVVATQAPNEEEVEATAQPVILPVTGEDFISAASVCYSSAANTLVRYMNFPFWEAYVPARVQQSEPKGEITRIVIPSLSVDVIVEKADLVGTSWSVEGLGRKAGWLENTSLPGMGGNTVVAGHVSLTGGLLGPFYNLTQLKTGARIYVYTDDSRLFVYALRETRSVQPTDLSVAGETATSQLTLITCSDWSRRNREYLRRVAVVADLVSYKDLGRK